MQRTASAHWSGNLKQGKGAISSQSGVLRDTPYSFNSRFGGDPHTNPEELLAAAHAGCFTMALSLMLQEAGFTADALDTEATVVLDDKKLVITDVHLRLTGKVPGISADQFAEVAGNAKANCPVSKLFNANITLDVRLG